MKTPRVLQKVLLTVAMVLVCITPVVAHAQLLPKCEPVPGGSNTCGVEDIFNLLVNIYNYMLGFAAIVAFLFIVGGGVMMIYHGFDENPTGALETGKLTLRRAIFGLVIVMCAYLVVNTLLTFLGIDRSSKVGEYLIYYGLLR